MDNLENNPENFDETETNGLVSFSGNNPQNLRDDKSLDDNVTDTHSEGQPSSNLSESDRSTDETQNESLTNPQNYSQNPNPHVNFDPNVPNKINPQQNFSDPNYNNPNYNNPNYNNPNYNNPNYNNPNYNNQYNANPNNPGSYNTNFDYLYNQNYPGQNYPGGPQNLDHNQYPNYGLYQRQGGMQNQPNGNPNYSNQPQYGQPQYGNAQYGEAQYGQTNFGYNPSYVSTWSGGSHLNNITVVSNNPYPIIEPVAQPYNRFNMTWELVVTEASAFLPGITSAIVIGAQRLLNQNSTAIIQPLVTGHLALDIFLQVLIALFGTYAVFLIGYLLHRSGESFKAIGLTTKYTKMDVGLTLLLTFGAFVISFGLGYVEGFLHLQQTNNPAVAPQISHYYIIVGFADSLYTSFLEEVAVCGFLLHRLEQMNVKPAYAVAISTALRCSYHVYGGWPLVAMTIPFGIMQAIAYQKTRSIKCQVGAHFIYDFIIFSLNIL